MQNPIEKLRDPPERAKQMRVRAWPNQKRRCLAMTRSVEKREARYKRGILDSKSEKLKCST